MIITSLRNLGPAMLGVVALAASAAAQGAPNQPASNPTCVRLEAQLATINAGSTDPTRADQVKRAEDAVAKQQADLDRTLAQAHKQGCEGQGFLSLFSSLVPQCGPINSQIQQMRGNLDRATTDLEQLKSGTGGQDSQRRALIGQLAQNNCGAQYTTAANQAGPMGFFDRLFGGGGGGGGAGGGTILNPGGDGAPAGTYRTVCVRTCDGYYFPISYSTVPSRFADDERSCQRLCPAAEVALFSYRNPGEDMEQAVSVSGQPYTALPTAFHYRKEFTAACSCRKPGQSWADALKDADDSSTLQGGDIVVTDQTAKTLSQAPQPKPAKGAPAAAVQPAAVTTTPAPTPASAQPANISDIDPGKRTVRTVGPPFVSR
jgi:Protein of unknown function (DUF2865)